MSADVAGAAYEQNLHGCSYSRAADALRSLTVEPKWQARWSEAGLHRTTFDPKKPKFYALDMFPYPSGAGLHVGHCEGYTATDIITRWKRMQGFNVLHPMGWDAFGLPAENYAIKTGVHPRVTTAKAIANFRRQIEAVGFAYDWEREVNTTDPGLLQVDAVDLPPAVRKGLAYEGVIPINWCPSCKTGLANEEVSHGRCERCGTPVERKDMRQWMLRITAYADRLLEDLDELDWPESTLAMQRNWIGRTEGAEVDLQGRDAGRRARRSASSPPAPDTLFGATYMVLAPEHPLVAEITTPEQRAAVAAYQEQGARARATSSAPTSPRRRPASSPAPTRSTRSTARRSRSGSPTTCWRATAPAPSWPCRRTTSATSRSRRSSACRSSR